MRDPNRIYQFTQKLCHEWAIYLPDMRFGQLITNAMTYHDKNIADVFYMEDDQMLELIDSYIGYAKENYVK